ncbi:hypothetical protein BBJ28_00017837 [Nothophytophthora sp. Chile5]|nr:hypothetical protein BBJ28_00017837 [Nothophytophthora sp. Chile5]
MVVPLAMFAPASHFAQTVALALHNARGFASPANGFRCEECGQTYVKWQGQCSGCSVWNTIVPAVGAEPLYRQANAASFSKSKPKRTASSVAWARRDGREDPFDSEVAVHAQRMNEVELDTFTERIELPERELVRRRDSSQARYCP